MEDRVSHSGFESQPSGVIYEGRFVRGVWLVGWGFLLLILLVVALAPLWSGEEFSWGDWEGWVIGLVWLLGMLVLAVGVGGISYWSRNYALQELVLVSLTFSLALVLLGVLSPLMGAWPVVILGPFAFLLHDVWFKQAYFLLVGVLVGLVPRVGAYFLFHLLWVCSQGLLHGYISPGLLLFGGVSVFFMEAALFLSGLTKSSLVVAGGGIKFGGGRIGRASLSLGDIVRIAIAGALAIALVVWVSLHLWSWLYRLEWSWWYIGLQMVSGAINGGLGLGLGLWLSGRLQVLRRGWRVVGLGKCVQVGSSAELEMGSVFSDGSPSNMGLGRVGLAGGNLGDLIVAEGLSFSIPRGEVFSGVSLVVGRGELVGLSGISGSGKSSLLWQLQGLLASGGGRVWGREDRWGECRLWEWWGAKRWARHCGLLFQEVRPQLLRSRVSEEVGLAAHLGGFRGRRWEWAVRGSLLRFGLASLSQRRVGDLSGGEMQRLALAALWVGRHRVLLLDEPFSHQDGYWRRRLAAEIKHQVKRGLGVLVAEHRRRVLGAGVRWMHLSGGVLGEGEFAVDNNQAVRRVGNKEGKRKFIRSSGRDGLRIDDLCFGHDGGQRWGPLNATLAEGMMVGLAGANGSGKSSLLEVCLGLRGLLRGSVYLGGNDVSRMSVRYRARVLGWLPQDTDLALGELTGRLELQRVLRLGKWQLGGRTGIKHRVDECLERLDLKNVADKPLLLLSAGERRRLALAAAMVHGPRVLLLDEPLAGASLSEANNLLDCLRQAVREGWVGCVLLATHDKDLLQPQIDGWWVLWNRTGRLNKKLATTHQHKNMVCGRLRVVNLNTGENRV